MHPIYPDNGDAHRFLINRLAPLFRLRYPELTLLYNPDRPLAAAQCSFVIARLTLDLHAEITWPGRVDIGTRAGKIGCSSVTLEQGLFQNGQRTATATTVIVHVNGTTRRSQAFSDVARQAFEALL